MRLNRTRAVPPWASAWGGALRLIPAGLLASGCTTLPDSTTHPNFAAHHETYAYTETHATVQQNTLTCGLACLVSVLGTWGVETNEAALSAAYPDQEHDGYTLEELKAFAEAHSLSAFVVQWDDDPRGRLEEQMRLGRPVICAVSVPWTMYGMHGLGMADAMYRGWSWRTAPRVNHFVVVCGWSTDHVLVMDPRVGLVKLRWSRFLEAWGDLEYAGLLVARE